MSTLPNPVMLMPLIAPPRTRSNRAGLTRNGEARNPDIGHARLAHGTICRAMPRSAKTTQGAAACAQRHEFAGIVLPSGPPDQPTRSGKRVAIGTLFVSGLRCCDAAVCCGHDVGPTVRMAHVRTAKPEPRDPCPIQILISSDKSRVERDGGMKYFRNRASSLCLRGEFLEGGLVGTWHLGA
jgi:hypothetical protein